MCGGLVNVTPCIDDVPELSIQNALKKLESCKSDQEFQDVIGSEEYTFRFSCGVNQPSVTLKLNDREKIVSAVCLHSTVLNSLAELEQLLNGLSTLEVSSLIRHYPSKFRSVFEANHERPTASTIQGIYVIDFSPAGSNIRMKEEELAMLWTNFLIACDERTPESELPSIEKVLMFLTACNSVPPLGYGVFMPTINFSQSLELPKVSTCALTFTIPLSFPVDQQAFNSKMNECIINSEGFAFP
jgi:hypothetical protein